MIRDHIEVGAGQCFVIEGKWYGRCAHCKEPILPHHELSVELNVAYHSPCATKAGEKAEAERQLAAAVARYRQLNPWG